jgi:hypothetical protein
VLSGGFLDPQVTQITGKMGRGGSFESMLKKIQNCFGADRLYYSRHARDEMEAKVESTKKS